MTKSSYKEQLDTLTKISKAITSDLYLEDILKLIVTLAANAIKAKICALWLLDERTHELKIRATQAMSREYLQERAIKVGEGVVGLVASQKEAIAILDVLKDPRYKEKTLAKKENLVSMLSIPMMIKNKVIGVISCYTTAAYTFNQNEIDLLSVIANQAAVAIENTELLVKTKIIQEELEARKKIERAKGILIKEQNIGEDEAYTLIRKLSMDKRLSMKDIAEAIILSHEIKRQI